MMGNIFLLLALIVRVYTEEIMEINCTQQSEFDPQGIYYLRISFSNASEDIPYILVPDGYSCPLLPHDFQHMQSTCRSVPPAVPHVSHYGDNCPVIYKIETIFLSIAVFLALALKVLKNLKKMHRAYHT